VAEDSNHSIQPYEGSDPYVFICYSHADTEVYDQIRWLQSQGINAWYDQGISPGSEWTEALARKIQGCGHFLYFATRNSAESEHCRRELNFAQDEKKRVMAVQLEPFELPPGLRLSLRNRQIINKSELSEMEYHSKVLGALGQKDMETVPASPYAKRTTSAVDEKPSVAVLAFDNMSGDPEQEYFSDGLTEEIIARLSKSPQLFVIARNSSFTYRNKPVKVQQVGKELGVGFVLEGSVRKAGERIRITAQLIDATTGNHIWTEKYDRELTDVFTVQDEIAQQIASNLLAEHRELEVSRVMRITGDSFSAYDSLWRGVYYLRKRTEEGVTRAKEHFEQAIALDPKLKEPYALLGEAIASDYLTGRNTDPRGWGRVRQLAQKSLEIDESYGFAHGVMADYYRSQGKHVEALAEAERSLLLDPNDSVAYFRMGFVLAAMARYEEALDYYQKAMRLDPLHPAHWIHSVAWNYGNAGRYEEAIACVKVGIARFPEGQGLHWTLAYLYLALWETQQSQDRQVLDDAMEMAEESVATDEGAFMSHAVLCEAYLQKKQYDQAITEAKKTIASSGGRHGLLAHVYGSMARGEEAIPLAERALQESPRDYVGWSWLTPIAWLGVMRMQ